MTFTRNAFLSAASAIALMAAGPVLAGPTGPIGPTAPGIQVAEMNKMNDQAKIKVKAESLKGKTLMDSEGKPIGEIQSVIVDGTGHIVALVASAGTYLGIGERDVAIDWNLVDLQDNGKVVKANLTKVQVEGLTAYNYPDKANRGTVYQDREYLKQLQGGKSFKGPGKTPSGTNQ